MKINTVTTDEHEFTKVLNSIANSPNTLRYIGSLPSTRNPVVAIVGTRRPSAYGKEVTHRLSYDLAARGVIIVSGLALGVDAIAHAAALEAKGTTIAVLGNPLPHVQPSANRSLGEAIVRQGGGIISEYEAGARVFPSNFLQRNRIVSGLSDAIIITEATTRSGTLNTAARALEQGREIFVVPGNITSPLSAGCNALLKQGARVATSYRDVLDVIAPQSLTLQTRLPLGQNNLESQIITCIANGERDGDTIMATVGVNATDFNTALTMLELAGSIRPLGGNRWTIN